MALNLKLFFSFFNFKHFQLFSGIQQFSRLPFPHHRQQMFITALPVNQPAAVTATLLTLPAPAAPALHLPPADFGCR